MSNFLQLNVCFGKEICPGVEILKCQVGRPGVGILKCQVGQPHGLDSMVARWGYPRGWAPRLPGGASRGVGIPGCQVGQPRGLDSLAARWGGPMRWAPWLLGGVAPRVGILRCQVGQPWELGSLGAGWGSPSVVRRSVVRFTLSNIDGCLQIYVYILRFSNGTANVRHVTENPVR